MTAKLTRSQRRMAAKLYLLCEPENDHWYRAGEAGDLSSGSERVTLASLYYRGLAVRRGYAGRSDAHEYRLTDAAWAACREAERRVAARKAVA